MLCDVTYVAMLDPISHDGPLARPVVFCERTGVSGHVASVSVSNLQAYWDDIVSMRWNGALGEAWVKVVVDRHGPKVQTLMLPYQFIYTSGGVEGYKIHV